MLNDIWKNTYNAAQLYMKLANSAAQLHLELA